jgi:hypothetical protein
MALRLLVALILLPTPAAAGVTPRRLPQGDHWRLTTARGVIHVLRPTRYRRRDAGIVVYVHGFNTTVDRDWKTHALPAQFARSGRNALLVAVSGPGKITDGVQFPSLAEVLREIGRQTGLRLPGGHLVALGHSAGYWTISCWLDHPRLDRVVLLDGMYGFLEDYRRWITGGDKRRLVLVARGTRRLSLRFIGWLEGVARRRRIPARSTRFTRAERAAKVVHIDSQFGHRALVSSGRVIPVVLGLTDLPALGTR